MSAQQFFKETEAVVQVLSGLVGRFTPDETPAKREGVWLDDESGQGHYLDPEEFTAIWQAVELLSRAYNVLFAMANFEVSKQALNIPDPQPAQQKKKAHLYGADGKPL